MHLLLTAGHASDYTGTRCLLPSLSQAKQLIADRGYDADWFIAALKNQGITPCIPPRKNRKKRRRYSKTLYKQRHKVEIMFGRIKDWRRIAPVIEPQRLYSLSGLGCSAAISRLPSNSRYHFIHSVVDELFSELC